MSDSAEKAGPTERVRDFVRDSRSLIGHEAADVLPGVETVDWLAIRRFCASIGDSNPLYRDPASSLATKYNSIIAPSTFVYAIRTPNSIARAAEVDYGMAPFFTHAETEWVDVMRIGDRVSSAIHIADVREGTWGSTGKPIADVVSRVSYRNSYGGLIGAATGTMSLYPYERGRELVLQRDIYAYSTDEIKKIEHDLAAEKPARGRTPRYWDEVIVGEELPQLVKGPVSLSDMIGWLNAEAKDFGLGSIVYAELRARYPGRIRTNPTTNWPYWDGDQEFEDIFSSTDLGFRMPVTRGQQRVCLAGQLCTDWMGDEAFLRRLTIDVKEHWCYGDTMWLNGTVDQSRVEIIGSATYHAVDLTLRGTNQLNESVLSGTATVYLPRPGRAVALPIPH